MKKREERIVISRLTIFWKLNPLFIFKEKEREKEEREKKGW